MDLTKPVIYRGLDLNDVASLAPGQPMAGYALTRVQYSDVQGEGYREKRSQADGYDAGSVYLGWRPLNISGEVYGSTQPDMWDRLQNLRRVLTPTLAYAEAPYDLGFVDFAFSQVTAKLADWPSGVIPLVIRARPQAQPSFLVDSERIGVSEYGLVMPYTAALWARDPRIYVATPKETALTGTGATGLFTNRGDYPAPLDILLYVTNAGARTFTFVGCGTNMTVTIPDDTAARLVRIDSTNKVCTYQVGETETLRMDLVNFAAGLTWPQVIPSPATQNQYTWSVTGGALAAGSKAMFSEAFA